MVSWLGTVVMHCWNVSNIDVGRKATSILGLRFALYRGDPDLKLEVT